MQLRLHTLPSPAMWKLASVEKTIKCRAFCRQPISLVQTIACIIASSPPSGESKLPDTGASCTRVWKLINQRREINYYAKKKDKITLKRAIFSVRGIWFLYPYGGAHGFLVLSKLHGDFNLEGKENESWWIIKS